MIEKIKAHFVNEWPTVKVWGLSVIGAFLSVFVPIIGFWVTLLGYAFVYPIWKAEPEKHQGVKIFAMITMILSFVVMMGLIYLLATDALEESIVSLIAHIIKY